MKSGSKTKRKVIDVVLTIDDAYSQHCGAVVASILHNNSLNAINIHIVNMGLSDANKALLSSIGQKFGQNIFYYDIQPEALGNLQSMTDYISNASFIRLFIHKYLPADIDKILYLDCDTIVRKDISELWNTDISDYMIGGIEDAPVSNHHQRLGYDETYPYINTGVMLINLKRWRDENVSDIFSQIIKEHDGYFEFNDQDIINLAFHKDTLPLPIKWNMMGCFCETPPGILDKYIDDAIIYGKDPSIVHYASWKKPWIRPEIPYGMEYFRYLRLTPWKKTARKMYLKQAKRKIGNLTGIRPLLKKLKGKK